MPHFYEAEANVQVKLLGIEFKAISRPNTAHWSSGNNITSVEPVAIVEIGGVKKELAIGLDNDFNHYSTKVKVTDVWADRKQEDSGGID